MFLFLKKHYKMNQHLNLKNQDKTLEQLLLCIKINFLILILSKVFIQREMIIYTPSRPTSVKNLQKRKRRTLNSNLNLRSKSKVKINFIYLILVLHFSYCILVWLIFFPFLKITQMIISLLLALIYPISFQVSKIQI